MPILIYTEDGQQKEHPFSGEVSIGSDAGCDLVLAAEGVAPRHAVIMRSALNKVLILVNLAEGKTWVNRRPVVDIQVLGERDNVRLGQVSMTLWELRITTLQVGDSALGKTCEVCEMPFTVGEEVVVCPQCDTPHHRDCWFELVPTHDGSCAHYSCSYPLRSRVLNALSSHVTFEGPLDEHSRLVELRDKAGEIRVEGKTCQANNVSDQVPFQVRQWVAYCPSRTCRAPYHLLCWLRLEKCQVCGYGIRKLVDDVFRSNVWEAGDR